MILISPVGGQERDHIEVQLCMKLLLLWSCEQVKIIIDYHQSLPVNVTRNNTKPTTYVYNLLFNEHFLARLSVKNL